MSQRKTELRPEQKYMQIVAVFDQKSQFLYEVTRQVAQAGCHTLESNVYTLLDKQSLSMLISGSWHQLAKVELALNQNKKFKPDFFTFKTLDLATEPKELFLPYSIVVLGLANPQHLHRLIEFFVSFPVHVHQIQSETFVAKRTHAPMQSIQLQLSIRSTMNLGELRDQFMLFCDNQNLDAFMEPTKN